ncbi:hypothetical protein SNE40_015175 [Patella caerulea]|uniref:SOCS box domain-containing protein n=1 Tax=Patella caerulea TaxID=87958 RepID=A0AAN8JJ62_PATCE
MHRLSSYLKLRKNVFENVRKQTRVPFGSTEEQCEHIGRGLCAQIDSGALTVQQVVNDSVKFALVNARDAESRYFSWLTLHMSLGICFQYQVEDKQLIRHVLGVLLPLSHGVDYGIFLRDLLESSRQPDVLSVINLAPGQRQSMRSLSNVPDKSLYYLKYSAGLKIDLRDPKLMKTIFDGTGRAVWAELLDRETCLYIDLPIAHAHLQPMMIHQPLTASLQVSSILLAIMNMKPNVVHLLLRYGASAQGPPLRYLLRTLGTIHLFPGMQKDGPKKYTIPVLMVADSLKYTLRTMPYVRFKTEMETIGNNTRFDTYYVKQEVLQFVPSWTVTGVPPLKHLCRCFIRNIFISLDQLPGGIQLLEIPVELRDYIDIKC